MVGKNYLIYIAVHQKAGGFLLWQEISLPILCGCEQS